MGHVELHAEEFGKGVDIFVHGQQHLDADEDKDDAQAVLQVLEVLSYGSQCKIEGTKAEYGEDITGEHDERVAAH